MRARFVEVGGEADDIRQLIDRGGEALVIVSRHGLGDIVFFSACFEELRKRFGRLYFASCVNAYTAIFHSSELVTPLYCGGLNGNDLGLDSARAFIDQLLALGVDLGREQVPVYHFGLWEPELPYEHPGAFAKGRRNYVELFREGLDVRVTPRYHLAPNMEWQGYINEILDEWTAGRELICLCRYGHTDPDKNLAHTRQELLALVDAIQWTFPDRFCILSLDYTPAPPALDGSRSHVRSVYGFLPCDAGSLVHVLRRARFMITVPTGPMVVAAACENVELITVWKMMKPYHFLDPQFGARRPVHALVSDNALADRHFTSGWSEEQRRALEERWLVRVTGRNIMGLTRAIVEIIERGA